MEEVGVEGVRALTVHASHRLGSQAELLCIYHPDQHRLDILEFFFLVLLLYGHFRLSAVLRSCWQRHVPLRDRDAESEGI